MSSSPLNEIKRGPKEVEFDEMRIKKEEEREKQMKTLDDFYKTTPLDENKMIKYCINCQKKGFTI